MVHIEAAINTLKYVAGSLYSLLPIEQYSPSGLAIGLLVAIAVSFATLFGLITLWRIISSPGVIYVDKGRGSKVFRNPEYRVQAKPDLLRKVSAGIQIEEYKSRQTGFYESDWAEALTAALAVRGSGIKVTQVLLRNQTQSKLRVLPQSDSELFAMIKGDVEIARLAARHHEVPFRPLAHKCRGCGFRESCSKRSA